MTCREFVDFLHEYLSGELAEAPRQEFQRHMGQCPHCVDYLRSYEQTVRLGKDACRHPDDPVPDEVPEELVRAILAARERGRERE